MAQEELTRIIERDITTRYDDGGYYVKFKPEDCDGRFKTTEYAVERILREMPEKYLDGLTGFKKDTFYESGTSYLPVFTDNVQQEWDNELQSFLEEKQRWCDQYGCE
jgi:hypothetical protein